MPNSTPPDDNLSENAKLIIERSISRSEIGECFYLWLYMLVNRDFVRVTFFHQINESFPLPISSDMKFTKERLHDNHRPKNGPLGMINSALAEIATQLEIDNFSNQIEDYLMENLSLTGKIIPDYFFNKISTFLSTSSTAAIIHIRHIPGDSRNLVQDEFEAIVAVLKEQNFKKFLLIGDLHHCTYLQILNKYRNQYCLLDYLSPIKPEQVGCSQQLQAWGNNNCPYPLALQLLLIKRIHESFPQIKVLIGRKSGAGLDMHAYAGMPTIFLDNDLNNQRYALPDNEGNWTKPFLSTLIPVFCDTKNEGGEPKKRNLALMAMQKSLATAVSSLPTTPIPKEVYPSPRKESSAQPGSFFSKTDRESDEIHRESNKPGPTTG